VRDYRPGNRPWHPQDFAPESAPTAASDANAAALSIDLRVNGFPGTAAEGIFLKSTSGGTTGKIINYVDPDGQTLFALLPDGSLLLPPVVILPEGSDVGLNFAISEGSWAWSIRVAISQLRPEDRNRLWRAGPHGPRSLVAIRLVHGPFQI